MWEEMENGRRGRNILFDWFRFVGFANKKGRRNEKELIFRSLQARKKNLIPTCLANGPMSAGKAPTKKSEKKVRHPSLRFTIPNPSFPLLTVRWWIKHVAGGLARMYTSNQELPFERCCEKQENFLTRNGVGAKTSSLNAVAKSMKTHYDLMSFPIVRLAHTVSNMKVQRFTSTSVTRHTTEDLSYAWFLVHLRPWVCGREICRSRPRRNSIEAKKSWSLGLQFACRCSNRHLHLWHTCQESNHKLASSPMTTTIKLHLRKKHMKTYFFKELGALATIHSLTCIWDTHTEQCEHDWRSLETTGENAKSCSLTKYWQR